MADNGFCSRETVLNYLLDKYKTTYKDIEARAEDYDPLSTVKFVEDCMENFVHRDIPFGERVSWVLDRICDFYDAEASYFVIYGRGRSIFLSSFFEMDSEGRAVLPTADEFSLLFLNRIRNEFTAGRCVLLEDVESLRKENREVYEKLTFVGVRNEIFFPVYSYGEAVGFITIYNVKGDFGGLSAVQKTLNVIATTDYELESTRFKNKELTRRLSLENNDNRIAEAKKNEEAIRFANAVSRRLGQRFRHTYVIDLETEDYVESFIKVFSKRGEKTKGDAESDFEFLVDSLAHAEFKKGLSRFLILSDLGLRLKERDETAFEYVDNEGHWCRICFQAIDRDKEGNVLKVLFTEEIIDKEKQSCEEKMHFLRSVSELYTAVYRIDLANGNLIVIKPFAKGRNFENFSGNLKQMMDVWAAEFLFPDASEEERDFFNMTTLPLRLRLEGKLSIDLNTTKLGWVRAEFKTYARESNGEPQSVLFMIRSTAEEKRYIALNEVISETYKVLAYVSLVHNRYKTLIYSDKTAKFLPDEGDLDTAIGIMRLNVSDEDRDKVMEFMNPADLPERMSKENVLTLDYRNTEGQWAKITALAKLRNKDNRVRDVIFSIQLIDEIKRKELEKEAAVEWAYEEAKQANATKTGFFSNLSHDIRTPMNAIVGMTRIALDNQDNPVRVEDCLLKIKSSSDHLLSLINDSLDLSRIESGKIVIAHESVNLHELENNFMSIMQGYMVDRKLEIITDSQPLEVDYVLTDGLRLRQVVLNILSNAVKYTPDGKNIIYRTENRLSDDSKKLHMKYTIADSGIGMSQEFLKKIYEPFSQVERDGVHSNYKGTGLGMVIVKSFVDMLGGTIEIQSEVNVGTVVTLNFEFDIDPHPVKKKTEGKASADKTVDLKNVKIMLVEDNDINREIAVELLKSMNMEIIEAVDGEDAVNKFRKSALGEYKCIFMDIMMPVMNGYEATKAIRSMDRDDAKSVPIIAMTANAFMEDVKMSKECGMNEHISKPIDPERVKEVVAKYLVK